MFLIDIFQKLAGILPVICKKLLICEVAIFMFQGLNEFVLLLVWI